VTVDVFGANSLKVKERVKMKKGKMSPKIATVCISALLAVTLLILFSETSGWAKENKLPKTIYWGCRYVGGSLYTVPATMAEKVGPQLGRKIRMIPGNDVEMINMMRAGRAHLATFAADNYWASMGLAHYATFAMGPQPLRLIWPGWPLGAGSTGLATKKSGIKTPYDLKGKRLIRVIGAAWSDKGLRSQLAFGNLTYDDVTVIDVSSTGAQYKGLNEGKGDYCTGSVTSPGMYELASSSYGFTIVKFPFDDKEGWTRMQKIMPYYTPGLTTQGAGLKEGESVETPMYPWPITTTLEKQSDEFAYAICEAIYAKIDDIMAAYKPNKSMEPKHAIRPEACIMAPFHPGAIKFFKEKGLWTDAHEKANNARLEHLKKVNARWEQFVEESEEKMKKTKKKVNPLVEWPKIVENEIGLRP
jgi:TRAP transporter TAXI family solute receptor